MISLDNYALIDISPTITESIAIFPGDTPYRREVLLDTNSGANLTLSKIETTVHLGAHTDAPNHYAANEIGIDECSLAPYLGACQVITVRLSPGERIYPRHFSEILITTPRILFRTDSFLDPNVWSGDFNSLSPEAIHYLAAKNVVLVGIDTPSIDPAESKALETHQAVYQTKMAILEGIILNKTEDKTYHLIALPLRLQHADASPVRAILLDSLG